MSRTLHSSDAGGTFWQHRHWPRRYLCAQKRCVSSTRATSSWTMWAMASERARAFVWARMSVVASACATLACSMCRFRGPCGLPLLRGLSPQVGVCTAHLGCLEPGVACMICGASVCLLSTSISISDAFLDQWSRSLSARGGGFTTKQASKRRTGNNHLTRMESKTKTKNSPSDTAN
jgi:hypothetical protein